MEGMWRDNIYISYVTSLSIIIYITLSIIIYSDMAGRVLADYWPTNIQP